MITLPTDRKRHTNLPPLPEERHNNNSSLALPTIHHAATPVPSRQRYRLNANGWEIETDYESPQKGTIPFDVVYAGSRFWFLSPFGAWQDCNTEQIKLELIHCLGLWHGKADNELNPLEQVLRFITTYNRVDAVYSMAGYTPGIYCTSPGKLVLVPSGPHLIKPKKNCCENILRLLKGMFEMPEEPLQLEAVLSMWKLWYISLRDRTSAPGQVQVFIGPTNTGKTFIQENIITPLLGGREAEPYAYLSGETRFNDDVLEAEHLKCSDAGSKNANTRQIIASKLKELLFNTIRRAEGKNAKPISIAGSSHLTISVNTDPEDLKMLPLSTDSTVDKIATFWVKNPGCFPAFENRTQYWDTIHSELPAFAQYLLDFIIPAGLQQKEECQRCGVDTYRSRQAEDVLRPLAPEESFWETLVEILSHRAISFEGFAESTTPNPYKDVSATAIYSRLLRLNAALTRSAASCSKVVGTYLTRIAAKKDGRVKRNNQHDHNRTYTITWKAAHQFMSKTKTSKSSSSCFEGPIS